MPAKFSPSAPGHICDHPVCCPQEAAGLESAPLSLSPKAANPAEAGGAAVPGACKRWLLWFAAFFGIYASSSMCPFCGTPGCPVGAGGAALVGGFFAVLWQYGKNFWDAFKRMVAKLEK